MTIGVLCFPAGWDNDHVRGICGSDSEDYKLGNCGIRWAFVLAAVAILDTWILGCLAFTLSHRHAKPIYPHHNESQYISPGSIYKGRQMKFRMGGRRVRNILEKDQYFCHHVLVAFLCLLW